MRATYPAHLKTVDRRALLKQSEQYSLAANVMTMMMILESILGKQGGRVWTGLIWLAIGTSGGPL